MTITLHWFRRDFRLHDNTALQAACASADSVLTLFVLDPRWFAPVTPHGPGKVGPFQATFWLESLRELSGSLAQLGIPLLFRTSADPLATLRQLAHQAHADTITYNKEYEPDQLAQDTRLESAAPTWSPPVRIHGYKDAVLFEEHELLTGQQTPYTIFTPYKNAYLKKLCATAESCLPPTRSLTLPRKPPQSLLKLFPPSPIPTAPSLGYPTVPLHTPPGETAALKLLKSFAATTLKNYPNTRNFPALGLPASAPPSKPGTSLLSAHLNAGTLSIRQALRITGTYTPKNSAFSIQHPEFAAELIWRDFYRMILFNFPHTTREPFQAKYRHLRWQNNPGYLRAFQTARTGYPIVDAALRQLCTTGFMHNRLRMITAMFLTKDLDTHWQFGETFFMENLADYDLASNLGGWQWSASTGTDAAPYFRIMNPTLQSARFDPEGHFIRHYLPELSTVPLKYLHAPWTMSATQQQAAGCLLGKNYPHPIVDHAAAKQVAIAKFKGSAPTSKHIPPHK